jgi:hypothetical protein
LKIKYFEFPLEDIGSGIKLVINWGVTCY